MTTLKTQITAISSFLNSIKSAGIFDELVFMLKPIAETDTKANDDVQKAVVELQHLVSQSVTATNEEAKPQHELPTLQGKDEPMIFNEDKNTTTTEAAPAKSDDQLVQIKVNRDELNRRISSFIVRKRKEVDESNSKEFCSKPLMEENNPLAEEMNSCARVDAIFVPRLGCKSHVKVSKVDNVWGPQTVQPSVNPVKEEPSEESPCPALDDIEERLKNMESHMRMKSNNNFRMSVYTRLKDLEDRILFLEGLSPDYFHPRQMNFLSPRKKSRKDRGKILSNCSIEELQQKMQDLKDELKYKSTRRTHVFHP